MLVLEAADLPSRGKLRPLVEKAANAAAIACYPLEGRALESEIKRLLTEAGVSVEADALAWLGAHELALIIAHTSRNANRPAGRVAPLARSRPVAALADRKESQSPLFDNNS